MVQPWILSWNKPCPDYFVCIVQTNTQTNKQEEEEEVEL